MHEDFTQNNKDKLRKLVNNGIDNVQMPYVGKGTGQEKVAHNFGLSSTVENADTNYGKKSIYVAYK